MTTITGAEALIEAVCSAKVSPRALTSVRAYLGAQTATASDYPDFAHPLAQAVSNGEAVELDKMWHGLHYLLTGSADERPVYPLVALGTGIGLGGSMLG